MVSKTIGRQLSCRFDPDLRQYELMAGQCGGITADLERLNFEANIEQNTTKLHQKLSSGGSSSGRTVAFEAIYEGSNPSPPAKSNPHLAKNPSGNPDFNYRLVHIVS